MFVNRKRELETLEREYKKDSAFVILYGRRRTGKTTLIEEFIKSKNALYFLATEEADIIQRRRFQRSLFEFTKDILLSQYDSPLNWEKLFLVFSRQSGKKILIIDEFQYLAQINKAIPSILQFAWDNYLKNSQTMVILCGSLITMMESSTLNYTSPLYGRRTAQVLLKEIPFRHYGKFFKNKSTQELIEFYAVTGGIPRYIIEAVSWNSTFEFIENSILNKDSFLNKEPYFLLEREIGAVGTYFSILSSIASGKTKIGEIASSFNLNSSYFTRYLKTLRDMDVIEKIVPATVRNPERSKAGVYKIKDNFLSFWFRYVFPNMDYIEINQKDVVMKKIRSTFRSYVVPIVYEDVCRETIPFLVEKGRLPFAPHKIGKWWDKKDEIDIVALSDKNILVGECKYKNEAVGTCVLHELERKSKKIAHSLKPFYVIFSKNGFRNDLKKEEKIRDDLILIHFLPEGHLQ